MGCAKHSAFSSLFMMPSVFTAQRRIGFLGLVVIAVALVGTWPQLMRNVWSLRFAWSPADLLRLDPALSTPPVNHSRALLWPALQAYQSGDLASAAADLISLTAADNREAWSLLGRVRLAQADWLGTIEAWHAAGDVLALESLGAQAFDEGDYPRALLAYQAVITLQSDNSQAYHMLGQVLLRQEQFAEAEASFGIAADLRPLRGSQMAQAKAARDAGHWLEAIKLYETILTDSPDYGPAYFELAWTYQLSGDVARAVTALEQGWPLLPEYTERHYTWAGRIYDMAGLFAEARARYQQALALNPDSPFLQRRLAQLADK